jgi:hypothetical protein
MVGLREVKNVRIHTEVDAVATLLESVTPRGVTARFGFGVRRAACGVGTGELLNLVRR